MSVVTSVADTVAQLEQRVTAVESDVAAAVAHPSPSTIRQATIDLVTVLSLLTGLLGVIETAVPASRGTVSLALSSIGWGLVVLRHAIDVLGGQG